MNQIVWNLVKIGSPQMWVWPQLVFGGSRPSPIVIGGPFPQAKPLPSLPSPSSSPTPPWLFLQGSGRGRSRLVGGGGVLERRAVEGGGSKRHLGPDPLLGAPYRSLGNGVRKNGVRNRCPYRRCGVDTEIPYRLFSLISLPWRVS